MRLLVTNTVAAQAYTVIRALRPYADTVVATVSGQRPLGIWPTCSAAYSRLVDRRYQVPSPDLDWHEGRISPENTAREQTFIDAILEICRRERIDTIFPSEDAWVYVLSKNKKLLEQHGILVPVPDYDTVIKPLDKYRTIRCAEEVGFPTPRTYLPENDADVVAIARQLDPPWVIKPRFTTGGRGMALVNTVDELQRHTRAIQRRHSMPIIQEYIPGRGPQHFYVVLDRAGRAWSVFTPTVVRTDGRVSRNDSGACISAPPHALSEQAVRLVSYMGWWGGATVQTKRDARDGQLKLMEVNPRLGRHLWHRTELGINGPLMCLKIARNEPYEPAEDYPVGCVR
jgi:biotin carboxylase